MALPTQTLQLLHAARALYRSMGAEAVLIMTETDLDWDAVRDALDGCRFIVSAHDPYLASKLKARADLNVIPLDSRPSSSRERLSLALLEALTNEQLRQGAHVVILYDGLEVEDAKDQLDSISIIHLGEHLERLTARDLRKLDTQVPIETLKAVVDLAAELGREGREGKPVGTMFVVGDTRKVMSMSHLLGFDPVRGYSRKERNLRDRRVRDSMKEIAKLDGAFVVDKDGTVVAAARYIDTPADGITLSKGLGSRHWAAAAVSKKTRAVAIAVSESTGVVRVFQNGEVVLHIAPRSRPILWRTMTPESVADGSAHATDYVA